MAWPVDISSAGCHSQTTLVPCRGVNSLTYDLLTNQGVVSSRAVPIYCDLLRLSFDWVALFSIFSPYIRDLEIVEINDINLAKCPFILS